ncbi:hypothetical protein OUZ56_010366 [Daphnia magna]|uniref:Uncharacterized protein n=1 Tax=Daphnia magna TaxID=35525 RepID=A0ABR0AID6_9CRUS|nr:hypothetical protein OUZ56_010366 [Daphnia magna]
MSGPTIVRNPYSWSNTDSNSAVTTASISAICSADGSKEIPTLKVGSADLLPPSAGSEWIELVSEAVAFRGFPGKTPPSYEYTGRHNGRKCRAARWMEVEWSMLLADTSSVEKLHGDVTIPLLRSWRNRWNDFAELSQLATYPGSEQMAAFRMALDPAMQQVVEVALGIPPTTVTTPDFVLDRIADYVRAKRNIALDRVAFEERRQGPSETFNDFYIALRRLAEAADLCATCFDTRLVTRIIAGTRDAETKKKLLAMSPFPALQSTINICRSEESARANQRSLSGHSGISMIQKKIDRNGKSVQNTSF